jgi:DNA-binding response OmpR family regulator
MIENTDHKEKRTITGLIVDDDPEFVELVRIFLKRQGIHLESESSPDEFLKRLKHFSPDFCMVDLKFGKHSVGFSLVEQLRKQMNLQIPLFLVSGESDFKAIAHAMEIGATDYILKPVDPKFLVMKISRYTLHDPEKIEMEQELSVPDRLRSAKALLKTPILSVDELGLTLWTKHLISKGTVVQISGDLIKEITSRSSISIKVITSEMNRDDTFSIYAEFDQSDREAKKAIRQWFKDKTAQAPKPSNPTPPDQPKK